MSYRLLVKEAFDTYEPGDRITDTRTMNKVTKSHPDYILREAVEDQPEETAKLADAQPPVTTHVIQD